MPSATFVKLGLAIAGVLLFGVGVRWEQDQLRWVAIGLVALAFLMRFVRPAPSGPPDKPPDDGSA